MRAYGTCARLGLGLFAWSSAAAVAACGSVAWFGSEVTIMGANAVRGIGLTYEGRAGAALAFLESCAVLAAWFSTRSSRAGLRRAARLTLLAWALLWCANAVRWVTAEPEPMSISIGLALLASLLCAAVASLSERPRIAS
jgi:hypothetical protein